MRMKSLNIGELKIKVPIIQGGMGIGISLSKLASAVANMGGVGIISTVGIGQTGTPSKLGWKKGNIEGVRREIRKAREMSSGVLGVNIMAVSVLPCEERCPTWCTQRLHHKSIAKTNAFLCQTVEIGCL